MEKVWEIRAKKHNDLILALLTNRGIVGVEEVEKFLQPDFERDLHDPFLMKNLKKAVERIVEAKEKGERVGIFTDYDADGIPAGALLSKALKAIGIKSYIFIPNREHGYGLSKEGIDYFISNKCSLIITADLGIKNFKEAQYCRGKIDLIITDHHLPDDDLPEADLVINPKIKGDRYPFKELSGCGVVYKIIQGLSKYCSEIDERFLKWNLDLVAISTISDVVPLLDENRVLAKYGLTVLNKTKNLGLQKLIKIAALDKKPIGSYQVGFQIGPRINAPGRIDHATKSFELLVTEDENEASELAHSLNEKNEERQMQMERVFEEAAIKIEKEKLAKKKIIVVAGKWPKGVIGPTASRIAEKYSRPSILFSVDGNTMVGSARSVSEINILELIESQEKLLMKFGGHKYAAGVTVDQKKYKKFIEGVNKQADNKISEEKLLKKIKIDTGVSLKELSKKLYEKIILFEPFGMGNPKPVFSAENIDLENLRFVGREEKHLSFLAKEKNEAIKSICFDAPVDCSIINTKAKWNIAFSLDINVWNNEENLNLNIIDLKQSRDLGSQIGEH